MVQAVFPGSRLACAQPLGGMRNTNFKIQLDTAPNPLVLRIYEHDSSLWQKELDLMRLVGGSVPVPEVIYAEPAFALLRYIEGITFRELARGPNHELTARAARSIGATLARIGEFTFEKPGWLAPATKVTTPLLEGPNPIPRFIDSCLASPNLQRYMPAELRGRISAFVWPWAPQLAQLDDEARLVHGDFGKQNVLVSCAGRECRVAAVLDWEFAVSGSPLADVGHFLRYERAARPRIEPHFSNGYRQAGGKLPQGWRPLARVVDLTALCESLTHDDLPHPIAAELAELVLATIENRDPQFVSYN